MSQAVDAHRSFPRLGRLADGGEGRARLEPRCHPCVANHAVDAAKGGPCSGNGGMHAVAGRDVSGNGQSSKGLRLSSRLGRSSRTQWRDHVDESDSGSSALSEADCDRTADATAGARHDVVG